MHLKNKNQNIDNLNYASRDSLQVFKVAIKNASSKAKEYPASAWSQLEIESGHKIDYDGVKVLCEKARWPSRHKLQASPQGKYAHLGPQT